jgi:ankyrin repeat protein
MSSEEQLMELIFINLKNTQVCDLFIKNLNYNITDSDGDTLLIIASRLGLIDLVEGLLKIESIKIDYQNNNGNTAMMEAIYQKNFHIVNILLFAAADPFVLNKINENVYDYAIRHNYNDLVSNINKFLLIKLCFNCLTCSCQDTT